MLQEEDIRKYENINNDIKEMISVSNILLELKNSEKIILKNQIIEYIFSNIKNIKINEFIHLVSKYNISYNIKDRFDNTLLMLSCIDNNVELFTFLLTYKLNNIDDYNHHGYTILHYIAFYSRVDFLFNITLYTNKFDILTYEKNSPLHIACKNGDRNFVSIYINFSKNFSMLNKIGKTPIMLALENKHYELIFFLINHKYFDINDIVDKNKNRLLHYACMLNMDVMINYLLSIKNIDINVTNKFNKKPIFYAYNLDNKYAYEKLYLFAISLNIDLDK